MHDLKRFHTFSIPVNAFAVEEITTLPQLLACYQKTKVLEKPFLFIGEGSDVLFTENFSGTVAINRMLGKKHYEDDDYHYLTIAGGENWHQFVKWCVQQGIGGLENLALIPGCVGSAPIQNIGAYGVEVKDFLKEVKVLDLDTQNISTLTNDECQFGYRESIFKHALKDRHIIIEVTFKLPKKWQPQVTYGELAILPIELRTPQGIFDKVCEIRANKLPDPRIEGNAGSFFKNPIVDQDIFSALEKQYPQMPHYPQTDGTVKLAAGWLIDQCQLKGYQIGGAKVHPKQALVLVNVGNATADDVVALARYVREKVLAKFGVALEPEVRFIGNNGEIDASSLIS
ncbi:UDP-N-acetylenolpyruvoylglucosamine reductase [Actinobacillus delphinicola]|uniref:UDP-N-acetylmuramate dehydrogenase n=1 Tax=Actinobacillus delphinicola TaxID=51161 RepID=UPI0024418701|nr:UDP-N-acetylmuramate dehydrogenase [Actinobacillus delphinicola]MDG6897774.1 UDP-N-acetylenolpyruvoylglucosamine reductase [Actinobacillus delphinicola]